MNSIVRKITVFLLFLFCQSIAIAQPQPCGAVPIMANNCAEACVICDINGYTGTNNLEAGGQDIGNIFCSTPNDMHFISFIAGSTSLSIQIDVSNCTSGMLNFFSLDLGFFASDDCENFTAITECKEDLENGDSFVFNTTTPLTIGQHYYLVMDGSAGSICDWTFTVLDGSTEVSPLDTSGAILGDDVVCPELIHQYQVDYPIGAADFAWTLNGNSLNVNDTLIDLDFPNDGVFQLCVEASNVCDAAPPTCRNITVQSIPDTEIVEEFCLNDCFVLAGDTICETGVFEFLFQSQEGCDSLVVADLTQLETPTLDLAINICEGDTIFIGNTPFSETGLFQENLISFQECDSIVTLDLLVVVCNIQSSDFPTPVPCFGTETGQITFNVDDGTPPFSYTWENLNGTHAGNGILTTLGEMATLSDIPKGTYIITIEDNFGNQDIIVSEVTEPEVLALDFVASDYNSSNISCADGADGMLDALPTGGLPPYNFVWSSGQTTANLIDLTAGDYELTVTDAGGCELIGNFTLTEPDSLTVEADFQNANCDGLNTGLISVSQSSGGISPYIYSLNNAPSDSTTLFENLPPNQYLLQIIDANGCTAEIVGNLFAPEIPIVNLGENQVIELGEAIEFNPAINNIAIENIQWTTSENLTCTDCLDPSATPLFSGSYTLIITSEDGCLSADSVFVEVIKVRKAFLPNVFSPNQDGFNDFFTVFGLTPNVQLIEELSVFDRWGGLVFQQKGFLPNEPTLGWDGTAHGKALETGVFTYLANIRYLDGAILTLEGSVLLLR